MNYDKELEQYREIVKHHEFCLNELTFKKAFILGYLCSVRMLKNYIIFCQKKRFGNIDLALEIKNTFNEMLFKKEKEKESFVFLKDKIEIFYELHIPDLDDYGDVEASYALYSSLSLVYLYSFYKNRDINDITYILKGALESIYMKIEEDLLNDVLIKDELHTFNQQYKLLLSVNVINIEVLNKLIQLQKDNILLFRPT